MKVGGWSYRLVVGRSGGRWFVVQVRGCLVVQVGGWEFRSVVGRAGRWLVVQVDDRSSRSVVGRAGP